MKKINVARIVWIVGIFAILFIILYLVIMYKVKYQHLVEEPKIIPKYLYFYTCEANVCATADKSTINESSIVALYQCDNVCPVFEKSIIDSTILVLSFEGNQHKTLYDYKTEKIISNDYINFYPLYKGTSLRGYLIIDDNNKQGIADNNFNILLEPTYEELGTLSNDRIINYSYYRNYIIAKKDGKWGLMTLSDFVVKIDFIYDDYEQLISEVIN